MQINGFAAGAEDELADTISIGEYLLRNKEASYLLEVEGNSMEKDGIFAGDMIIFERTSDYKKGDMIVYLTPDGYRLAFYSSAFSKEILGVVVSSFRRYKK